MLGALNLVFFQGLCAWTRGPGGSNLGVESGPAPPNHPSFHRIRFPGGGFARLSLRFADPWVQEMEMEGTDRTDPPRSKSLRQAKEYRSCLNDLINLEFFPPVPRAWIASRVGGRGVLFWWVCLSNRGRFLV